MSTEIQAPPPLPKASREVIHIHDGVAGSGKTTRLIGKAMRIAEKGLKVQIITLTNAAALELDHRLKLSRVRSKIKINTLHSLSVDVLQQVTRKVRAVVLGQKVDIKQAERDFKVSGTVHIEQVIEMLYARLANPYSDPDAFDLSVEAVLVDEYQDHSARDFELLKCLTTSEVHLYGDPHQTLFGFRGAAPRCWEPLTNQSLIPYNCYDVISHPVEKTSFRVPQAVSERLTDLIGSGCPKIASTDPGGELRIVKKQPLWPLLEKFETGTIAVLGRYNDTLRDIVFDNDLQQVYDTRRELVILQKKLASGELSDGKRKKVNTEVIKLKRRSSIYQLRDRKFTLSTIHSAKGLEWDHVILFDDFKREEPNHYYVACTRALKTLIIAR